MSAKAQAKKDEIISELVETRRRILDAASSLPPEKQDEVFLGVWSIKDLLAHLVGWDFTNLEAAKALLAGQLPDFYSHYDRDWKTYNAHLVAEHKRDDFAELLSSVDNSLQNLVDFLETVPAEEFDKDSGVRYNRYKVTIARLLQAETKDEKTHYQQIEEFRQSKEQGSPMTEQTRDPDAILARYADEPAQLEAAIAGLTEEELDLAQSADTWTIRQIVHHLVDGDDIWKIGIKAALGNSSGTFTLQWYWDRPQDEWVESWDYAGRAIELSLTLFRANRRHILQLLSQIPDAWERHISIKWPEGQKVQITVGYIIEMQAGHVLGHIDDIRTIR